MPSKEYHCHFFAACRLLEQAMNSRDEDFLAGRIHTQKVMITHKYADPQPMDITIALAGRTV